MTNGGDVAEQLIRVSLAGTEIVLRLAGTAAKELAVFLAAACKSPDRKMQRQSGKHGKVRLKSMLQSGKPLEVFSVKERDLKKFVDSAKKYGILYCVVKNPRNCPDNLCDILVRADDAPKISRIAERYGFTTLPKATVEHERERTVREAPEPPVPNWNTAEDLVSEMFGDQRSDESNDRAWEWEATFQPNPNMATTERPHPSEPSYESRPSFIGEIFDQERPSVREELRGIRDERRKKEPDVPAWDEFRPEPKPPQTHKPPKKPKSKKGRKSR